MEGGREVSFGLEVCPPGEYEKNAAARIASALPATGSVILTGGTTAARIYPELAGQRADWSGLKVFFSDERCVPPDHEESNHRLVHEALLQHVRPGECNRMRGEDDPEVAADDYHIAISETARGGAGLAMLGMGADAHICALFPGSPALSVTTSLCIPVARPDGMTGITLTPPAIVPSQEILLVATGEGKAEAVWRALEGTEPATECPVRLLAGHDNVTFLIDEPAASSL